MTHVGTYSRPAAQSNPALLDADSSKCGCVSIQEYASLKRIFHDMFFFIVFPLLDFKGQTKASHSSMSQSVSKDVEGLNVAMLL